VCAAQNSSFHSIHSCHTNSIQIEIIEEGADGGCNVRLQKLIKKKVIREDIEKIIYASDYE
jgi:hypothetical protein